MGKEDALLKQYEILAQTTSEVTNWRQNANQFYLAATTTLLGISAYLKDGAAPASAVFCIVGIGIALIWRANILSCKKLNAAKFKVLKDIEKKLAYPIFAKEQEYYKKEKRERFTNIEAWIPRVFILAYLVILISLYGAILMGLLKI
jgi:hypothetical protein